MNNKLVSIVTPAFQEEKVLSFFYAELSSFLAQYPDVYNWEIIIVDDGSTDGTLRVLKEIRERDCRVKWISLSRNFGHQAALTAGLEHAKGDAVITMDSDLQHPVDILKKFIQKWEEGYDIVSAIKEVNLGESRIRSRIIKSFYYLINLISQVPISSSTGDFRLMSKDVLQSLLRLEEFHRFLRGMVAWVGFKSCNIYYVAPKRYAGKSKYSYRKLLGLALEGITSFSVIPLRISALVGFLIWFFSLIYAFYAVIIWIIQPIKLQVGWASLIFSIHFLCGTILMMLGIMGEYIGRIYGEIKKRPVYIIQNKDGV